jgi:hypothetical protein
MYMSKRDSGLPRCVVTSTLPLLYRPDFLLGGTLFPRRSGLPANDTLPVQTSTYDHQTPVRRAASASTKSVLCAGSILVRDRQ